LTEDELLDLEMADIKKRKVKVQENLDSRVWIRMPKMLKNKID